MDGGKQDGSADASAVIEFSSSSVKPSGGLVLSLLRSGYYFSVMQVTDRDADERTLTGWISSCPQQIGTIRTFGVCAPRKFARSRGK
jgi:hypothetical protein